MNNLNKNNNRSSNDNETVIDKVRTFVNNNFKYLSTGVICILLVIVVILLINGRAKEADNSNNQQDTVTVKEAGFIEESIPALDKLLSDYYVAYAQGDVAALKNYATPITASEEQYIKTLSEHVSSSRIIKTYVKEGMEKGSYAVFVKMEMGFENVQTGAPGLEFFYIKTNGQGKLYIDNAYSAYNNKVNETEKDSEIAAFIEDYEDDKDVEALQAEVKTSYEQALAKDEKLYSTINITLPAAGLNAAAEKVTTAKNDKNDTADEKKADNTTENEPAKKDTATQDSKPNDTGNNQKNTKTTVTKIKSERVYSIDSVNIRKTASDKARKIGSAAVGDAFIRNGVTKSGWSRIRYEGKTAYIKSEFLSKKKPAQQNVVQEQPPQEEGPGKTYLPVGTTVTLNSALNIRVSMSETSDLVGTAAPGEVVKVVMSYAEGWTKVEWNGVSGYMKTELLIAN